MYPEFVAIYIGLGIVALLQLATAALLLILFKEIKNRPGGAQPQIFNQQPGAGSPKNSGVAFCVGCGAQFDAALRVCPKCGRQR